MSPALRDGEWGVAVAGRPRRGDVVVVEDPRRPGFELVKRVTAAPGDVGPDGALLDGRYWVEGDRAEASTDSRTFGPVEPGSIKGRVVAVWWPRPRLLRAGGRGTKGTGSVPRRAAGPIGSA